MNMGETVHHCKWAIGDHVRVYGDAIHGRVTGICIYSHGHQYQVSWCTNGSASSAWIEEWRMDKVDSNAGLGF